MRLLTVKVNPQMMKNLNREVDFGEQAQRAIERGEVSACAGRRSKISQSFDGSGDN